MKNGETGSSSYRQKPTKTYLLFSLGLFTIATILPGCMKKATSSSTVQNTEVQTEPNQEMAQLIDTALTQLDELLIEQQPLEELPPLPSPGNTGLGPKSSASTKRMLQDLVKRVNTKWNSMGRNPCSIWTPFIRKFGKATIQPYFFMGGSVEAGAGIHGIVGTDYVWDFYNLQLGVFNYKSMETVFGAGSVGAGANTYLGLGFGQKKNVVDAWSGQFASVGVSGSLPILSNYLSGHITHFTARTSSGKADYSIQGGSIGLSAAMSLPTPTPGALQVAIGNWIVNKQENIKLARLFNRLGIGNSMTGQDTCQGSCIRFDNIAQGAGYTGRAVNLAKSLPLLMLSSSVNAFPMSFDKMMLLAIATGAYRDTRNRAEACKL